MIFERTPSYELSAVFSNLRGTGTAHYEKDQGDGEAFHDAKYSLNVNGSNRPQPAIPQLRLQPNGQPGGRFGGRPHDDMAHRVGAGADEDCRGHCRRVEDMIRLTE